MEIFSAPGESRECIEIARRVRREAERGTPFDQMAVLLRTPTLYRALLEEALGRAGVPAHFAHGTVRPDPTGRAFLSLLACAAEGLSARRFAEYLSLGEVPDAEGSAPPAALPREDRWAPPEPDDSAEDAGAQESEEPRTHPADLDSPVVAGSLRAPWRWERFLLDAAVIGGNERWQRRLAGLEAVLRARLAAQAEQEAEAARTERDLSDLAALSGFALPLLEALDELPREATWGTWLELLGALATRSLRAPLRVLSLLSELAPMSPIGPATLDEVRLVLGRHLTELNLPREGKRYGKLFVGPVESARGLSFEVVFVPGLAEKLFPQKIAQDPLLRDAERKLLEESALSISDDRVVSERLALRLSAGAAHKRLVLSWPRIDSQQARVRMPSFYGLEVLRAAEGTLPGFSEMMRRAEQSSAARIGWPAPREPSQAIDEAEHDLSLLDRAFGLPERERRGTGRYLLGTNPHLARALRARARRWLRRWTPADGLVQPSPEALAALARHLPSARSYSATALQTFASCPYKFLLYAVYKLSPREVPESIDAIEPMARGSLIHEVQYELLRELQEACALPIDAAHLDAARARLDVVLRRVSARWKDDLAPAIERVWDDSVQGIRVDLREWLRRSAEEQRWVPWRFELSFGLQDASSRDAHSTKEPVALSEGVSVRGSIDLVERSTDGHLRATDYKTGKAWAKPGTVIGGGKTLQPALYALVLEKLFPGLQVENGRLYYCTFAGEFTPVEVPLDAAARGSIATLVQTIAGAVGAGFLPAAPDERECERCDYLVVCGPGERQRTKRKPAAGLEGLIKLRELP